MNVPVVDAEVVREFMDKAEPFMDEGFVSSLSASLQKRTQQVSGLEVPWTHRWIWSPVSRRVTGTDRDRYQGVLETVWPEIVAGQVDQVIQRIEAWGDRPPWVMDWVTFWLHVHHPTWCWWARWVYQPENRTGAVTLILEDPAAWNPVSLEESYRQINEIGRFLEAVLSSTRRLSQVDDLYRPMVGLASVYAVYMFTMAAWKMTDEFTRVMPPFPVVVKTLLGLTRWEGKKIGAKSEPD